MYVRNAVSAPTCISPFSTRSAPNHRTATDDTFMMSMTMGNIAAIRRPALSADSVTLSLACAKRAVSSRSRTKARTTRMPVSCSRITRLMASMRFCMRWKCGTMREMIAITATRSNGMATTRIHDSAAS